MANISDFISVGGGGGGLTPVLANVNDAQLTATSGEYYIVSAAGVQITLPQSPTLGDIVRVYNRGGQNDIVIVFPGIHPIVDPRTEAPIRGQIELEDTASYEFTYDGVRWNLTFSGYFIGNPSATSGLEYGYNAVVNTAGTIEFSIQIADDMDMLQDAAVGSAARTGRRARITANVTDPDQPMGVPFLYDWPSLAEINLSSAMDTFAITAGGGSGDDFIELTNSAEETVLLEVRVRDASGNNFIAQYNHIVADNTVPVVTLTAGVGSAEAGENITTEIVNVVDPETAGTFPANASDYTITWVTPAGADVVSGCMEGDLTCTLTRATVARDQELVVAVEDAPGGVGMATRLLTWAQAGPPITADDEDSTNNGMQAFEATTTAIGGGFFTFIGDYDGVTIPDLVPLNSNTLTATVMAAPCPDDHTQNWYAYGYNPTTTPPTFTAPSTASSILSFMGTTAVTITTTGLTAASAVPNTPLLFGGISNSSGGSIVRDCDGNQVSSSWRVRSDIQIFSRWYHAPGTGGAVTLSTGETDNTVAFGSVGGTAFKRAEWSGTLNGTSTADRTATAVAPDVHRMGWFNNASGTGGTITNAVNNSGGSSTQIFVGNAGGARPSTAFGAVPINVTARMSNGVGASATWAASTLNFTNGGNGSAGTFTGTVTLSGGTNNAGTININGTFNPTDNIFSPGQTINVQIRATTFPTVGGAVQRSSDYRLIHDFNIRFTS